MRPGELPSDAEVAVASPANNDVEVSEVGCETAGWVTSGRVTSGAAVALREGVSDGSGKIGNAVGAGRFTAGKLHAIEMNSQVNSKSGADLRKTCLIYLRGA
jgi:hypothetical protein